MPYCSPIRICQPQPSGSPAEDADDQGSNFDVMFPRWRCLRGRSRLWRGLRTPREILVNFSRTSCSRGLTKTHRHAFLRANFEDLVQIRVFRCASMPEFKRQKTGALARSRHKQEMPNGEKRRKGRLKPKKRKSVTPTTSWISLRCQES